TLDNQHETAPVSATVPAGRQSVPLRAILAELRAGEVLVEFSYNLPRGEEVLVSARNLGNFQLRGDLPRKKGMPVGTYTVTAKYRDDWPAAEANVVVEADKQPKAIFHFDFGRVVLEKGEQDGVRYSINGKPGGTLGADAITIPLRPGPVTFSFEAQGFETATLTTNIASDMRLALAPPRLAPVLGFAALTSDPAPALVTGPGGKQWQTVSNQSVLIALPPGTYPMTASLKGFKSIAKSV